MAQERILVAQRILDTYLLMSSQICNVHARVIVYKTRISKREGDVGILHRDSIRLKVQPAIKVKSYESIHVTLNVGQSSVNIIILIYRLHPSNKNMVRRSDILLNLPILWMTCPLYLMR